MKNKKLFAILTLVCFMFTLMPVAAFAAVDPQETYIYTEDKNAEVDVKEKVTLVFDNAITSEDTLYVWFEESNNVPTTALGQYNEEDEFVKAENRVIEVTAAELTAGEMEVAFSRAGEYELHAATVAPNYGEFAEDENEAYDTWAEAIAAIADSELQTESDFSVVVVSADSADSNDYVLKNASVGGEDVNGEDEEYIQDGDTVEVSIDDESANGVESVVIKFDVYKTAESNTVVYANDIEVDATSGIDVTDVTVKRDGSVEIETFVNKLGTHKVYVVIDDFKATFKINANEGVAEDIVAAYVASTPVNIDTANKTLANSIVFKVYDEKGNELLPVLDENYQLESVNDGMTKAVGSNNEGNYNYVAIVEQPAKSDIENKNLSLIPAIGSTVSEGWTIKGAKFEEEGEYTFKVALNDGTSAKATIKVLEAGDPVALNLQFDADSVQLGDKIAPKSIVWMDANYVATDVFEREEDGTITGLQDGLKLAVTGAAVKSVDNKGVITVKDDEKYIGSEITVTVIDNENNLVTTKTLVVAAEAKELVLDTTAVPVDSTRTITVSLVDEDGNTVGLSGVEKANASVIVMSKPAGSDVTIGEPTSINPAKGQFKFAFSADTVGTVKVQAVLQTNTAYSEEDGVDNDVTVRYYTGVAEIKVGATGIEDVVVMSIGSNQVVVNDEVKLIDAAPMIQNARTFVPFRALAEAFGATVAFDEATQSVVAELDGTKVVMTIGAAAYTVNGVEKTADVAPFISDSRTMVPVRFVAEAFGISVTPTYNDNGSTADILFAK